MNFSRFTLISVATAFVFLGCKRPAQAPSAGFRLTLQDVATGPHVRVALVTIHTANAGSISVDEDGGHNSAALPDTNLNGLREGTVALIASRVAPPGNGDIYIQTLFRTQTLNGTYVGGPSTYPFPRATQLADEFTITAKNGDYPLNTPIEIARFGGKPVTLTVGKPTK